MKRKISPSYFRLAMVMVCPVFAHAQIAPGPLSRAHRQLEGVTRCVSCHEFGTTTRGFKCLGCHGEIRRRLEMKAGFHSRAYKASAGEADCRRCHQEHKGQTHSLIRLDPQNFDHLAQTGFALSGKHRQQKCGNCHVAAKIPAIARVEIKVKDLNRTFLGLRRECTACHKDQHQGQLGVDCLRCHSQEGFKPAPGFNHAAARFPLTGMHRSQPCQKCHGPKPGQEAVQFKGLVFSSCSHCHNDPHRGAFQDVKFRGSCDTCHNTGGWQNNHPEAQFNHTAAKFQLSGKHAALACSKCHRSADFHRPIAHERCRDCHEDPHNGQFARRAAGSDCAACHNDTGFKPALFDRGTHRLSAFPLEGKHMALRCLECHQPEGRGAVYISRKVTCPACHTDRHGGEFASAPHLNKCDDCHTVAGFQPTTFSVERHARTQFALTGRHASVTCDKCHKPLPSGGATPAVVLLRIDAPAPLPRQYHFASRTCNACHLDPHQTKLACETCHNPEQWQSIRPFDHSGTTFPIQGAHQKAKCIQCHNPSAPAGRGSAKSPPVFANTPARCTGCHRAKDAHGGQFIGGTREEDCSRCHVTTQWKGDDFNHDRTQFVLSRVHRDIACAKCHKEQQEAAGRLIRVYRGTPTECIKCH